MKRYFLTLITIILTIVMLIGCEKSDYINTKVYNNEKITEILRCLDEKDVEGLKKLFCNKIKDTDIFNQQILDAFVFFRGKTVSFPRNSVTGAAKTIKDGKTIKFRISPYIPEIKTDEKHNYTIRYYCYIINKNDKDIEGISEITIISEDGNECSIGDYYLVNPENQK